jgi:pimeloyl-ACP methyl ester carboxylesterase
MNHQQKPKPPIYREADVPPYQLPQVLQSPDGSPLTTARQWEQRGRPATLDLFASHVYGRSPVAPAGIRFESVRLDNQALNGLASEYVCRIVIPTAGEPFAFHATVLVPNDPAKRPRPTFLLLNNRAKSRDLQPNPQDDFWPVEMLIARGYVAAVIHLVDVQPDEPGDLSAGVIGALPQHDVAPEQRWATLAAWAWGASRAMDWLCTLPFIDPARVAVIGHSRGGKAALWAAAQDQRFAMVVSNESGCGGAALSRRRFGETLAHINNAFPHWFCENFKKFSGQEDDLPVDQHQLLALIAPRCLYVASAEQDQWADPRGEFLALAHASTVYALYGFPPIHTDEMPPLDHPLIRGPLAYHIRRGTHDLTRYDWERYLAVADLIPARSPSSAEQVRFEI